VTTLEARALTAEPAVSYDGIEGSGSRCLGGTRGDLSTQTVAKSPRTGCERVSAEAHPPSAPFSMPQLKFDGVA
jgi:hypothetical protein